MPRLGRGRHIGDVDHRVKSLPRHRGADMANLTVQVSLGLLLAGGHEPVNGELPLPGLLHLTPEPADLRFRDPPFAPWRAQDPALDLLFPTAVGRTGPSPTPCQAVAELCSSVMATNRPLELAGTSSTQ